MTDVFVSYSRRDAEFVSRLAKSIEDHGKQVWLDTDGIADAEVFPQAIRTAIEQSDAFLFVITPAAVESAYCEQEVEYARALGKRMVPVLRTPVPDPQLPAEIRTRNWIPFTDGADYDHSIERLVGALDRDLEHAKEHTRWLVKALEWEVEGRDRSFLLRGSELRAAETWFAGTSQNAEPAPTPLQREYLLASRESRARRQRTLVASSIAVAAVSLGLLAFALISRDQAISEKVASSSQALAAQSQSELTVDPEVSVLLAMRAVKTSPTAQATFALRDALDRSPLRLAVGSSSQRQSHVCGAASGPSAGYSPNGALIAEGDCSGHVTIMDTSTGRVVRRAVVARLAPAVSYSPGGSLLAVGTNHGVLLLDARTLARRATLHGFGTANTVAFSPNGRWLVAASDDGLTEWNVHTRARRRLAVSPSLSSSSYFVFKTVAFTPNNRYVLAGRDIVNGVPVYDVQTGRLVRTLPTSGVGGAIVASDPAGRNLAIATLSAPGVGSVSIWRTSDWRKAFTAARVPGDQIAAVAFNPSGSELAVGDADGTAGIWSLPTREKVLALVGHTAEINEISFSPDGKLVLTASNDGTTRVWSASGSERLDLNSPYRGFGVSDMRLLGSRLVATGVAGSELTAMTWQSTTGRLLATVRLGPASPGQSGAMLSPDGRYALIIIPGNGTTIVRSVSNGRVVARLPNANAIAENNDDMRFAIVRILDDGNKYVNEIVNNRGSPTVKLAPVPSLNASCPADLMTFSRNERMVAAANFCGQVAVWNAKTGGTLSTFYQGGQISDIAFSPAAPRLAVSSWDATTTVWNVRTGRSMLDLDGDTGGVDGVVYSSDGSRLLTTSIDRTARLWDAATGSMLRVLSAPQRLGDPAFSADAGSIATADSRGVIRVWNACPACGNAGALLKLARQDQTGVHELSRLEAAAVGSWQRA